MKAICLRASILALSLVWPVRAETAASRPAPREKVCLVLTDGRQVEGVPVRIDETELVLQVGQETRTLSLEEVKPAGVYLVKKRFVDLSQASVHMELGQYLLEHGEAPLARQEFAEAVRRDPRLKPRIQELLSSAEAQRAESRPAPKPKKKEPEIKFSKATAEEIAANEKRGKDLADQATKFSPGLHTIQTPHFTIYSSWPRDKDKALADVCEAMYRTDCAQFGVPATENVFAGRCPVFVFWEKEQFARFATEVDKTGNSAAAGYAVQSSDGYCHIAMSAVRVYDKFCEVLVHEGTHAFVGRYLSNRVIPKWANEGLAEYVTAGVVPRSAAARRHIKAARKAVRDRIDVSYILERGVGMSDFDYGIAQSIVRFMIETHRPGFGDFVRLIKEGKSEREALQESFRCSREELLQRWHAAAARL